MEILKLLHALPAPFNIEWLPIWIFAGFGAFITAFIMIEDIDNRLRHPFIAKPIIGLGCGMATAIFVNGQTAPPPINLAVWAFVGAVCSNPLLTGLLVFISDQKRQNEFYKSAQDKFLPFGKKGGKDE